MAQDEGPLDIEISDGGMSPDFLPGIPSGWTDALTGTDGPRLWDRTVSSEVARVTRYRRPITVALIEIRGVDRYARSWGNDVAERLFVQLAAKIGPQLTRKAMLDQVRGVHDFTAEGMVAPQDVGGKRTSACMSLIRLKGGTWSRLAPASGYSCGALIDTGVGG